MRVISIVFGELAITSPIFCRFDNAIYFCDVPDNTYLRVILRSIALYRFETIFKNWFFDSRIKFIMYRSQQFSMANNQNSKPTSNRNMVKTTLVAFVKGITKKVYNSKKKINNWQSYGRSKKCSLMVFTTVRSCTVVRYGRASKLPCKK